MFLKKNLIKFIFSFKYATKGILFAIKTQQNAKIHLFIMCIVIAMAIFLQISKIEWCIILICMALVFATEILNTAIEQIVDLVSPDFNKFAGNAKDAAAGAVLVTALISVIIGFIIFLPKIVDLLNV